MSIWKIVTSSTSTKKTKIDGSCFVRCPNEQLILLTQFASLCHVLSVCTLPSQRLRCIRRRYIVIFSQQTNIAKSATRDKKGWQVIFSCLCAASASEAVNSRKPNIFKNSCWQFPCCFAVHHKNQQNMLLRKARVPDKYNYVGSVEAAQLTPRLT